MDSVSRREFVAGLAAVGAVGGLVLRAGAEPTPASGTVREYRKVLKADKAEAKGLHGVERPELPKAGKLTVTEANIEGPFYRAGAPFRAKVTSPLEPGKVLVIQGRVWGFDTKKPLPGATLDVWQANAKGRYDNDDRRNPPKKNVFVNRARLITDETGYYEFETIWPGRYLNGDDYRPAHIHYAVSAPGYKTLVTQLYFKGDPFNKSDPFIKASLVIETKTAKNGAASYEIGTFDVVLAAAPRKKE